MECVDQLDRGLLLLEPPVACLLRRLDKSKPAHCPFKKRTARRRLRRGLTGRTHIIPDRDDGQQRADDRYAKDRRGKLQKAKPPKTAARLLLRRHRLYLAFAKIMDASP